MTDRELIEVVFQRVFLADFPRHRAAMPALLDATVRAVEDGKLRELDRACTQFLEGGPVRWPRYDAHLSYWGEADPRLPEMEDGEAVADGDFREAGKLLAHRLVTAVLQEQKRQRCRANADLFPFWRLRVIDDGRAYPDCVEQSREARHYTDPYWSAKALPCPRLDCRCSISASDRETA